MCVFVCMPNCVCVLSREEFVQAYLQYVFCSAVGELYAAFSSGFLKVCGGKVLSLFQIGRASCRERV